MAVDDGDRAGKGTTIIERISMFDIFLPQNTKFISLLGQNGAKK